MEPSGQVHHHQHHMMMSTSSGGSHVDSGGPQWSVEETREFLMIRAELDPTFMETKRNKVLWEVISTKMKERGYHRSGEQCKCKWKNLVTRYKGFETTTMEEEGGGGGGGDGGTMMMRQRQQSFPFYNELQAIFTGRMERMLWMETSNSNKRLRPVGVANSDDEEEEESNEAGDHVENKRSIVRRKINSNKAATAADSNSNSNSSINLKEILEELMKQQMQIERQWMKLYESKEEERRIREAEWRQKMEALENERMMFHERWREKEEQRSLQQETRSQKIDALITLLFNKLNS